MKNKRVALIILLAVLVAASAYSAVFHSIPIDHRAYDIIANAEIRGIVPLQTDVRPFSYDKVKMLLETILGDERTSDSEKKEVAGILSEFEQSYGNAPSTSTSQIAQSGFYRFSNSDQSTSATVGVQLYTRQTGGYDRQNGISFDSRNKIKAFINGDIANVITYDINFGLLFDKLDANAFLFNDFRFEGEGFYLDLFNADSRYFNSLPNSKILIGLAMVPEIDSSFFDGALRIRWGSIKRDWGPGVNNLQLSGSASPFDGIDISVEPFPWLTLSVVDGSLGKFHMDQFYYRKAYTELNTDKADFKYDNNFSSQRIELRLFDKLSLSVYESVVYKKRFELGYLNPLSIYMFTQNALGDLDNMLAGVDFSYTFPNVMKIYGGLSMTEMNTISNFFTYARNIIALQGGAEIAIPVFSFSKLTVQATYIPPFFGAHYELGKTENPWGCNYNSDYVNKGFTLSYPMEPDSFEFLVGFESGLENGWGFELMAKYQARSAQYADNTSYGTTMNTRMNYDFTEKYAMKDFFHNIWSHVASVEMVVSKRFDDFPVKINAGLRLEGNWDRSYTITNTTETIDGTPTDINFGDGTVLGDWLEPVYGVFGSISMQIYY